LQSSTNQLGCVARVYPKPHPTEYGGLKGFQWVSLLATLPTGVSRMGIGWVSGQELYTKSNGILICPKQEIWKADLENSKNRISMIPNLYLQGTVYNEKKNWVLED
jgi:hypothetical protein